MSTGSDAPLSRRRTVARVALAAAALALPACRSHPKTAAAPARSEAAACGGAAAVAVLRGASARALTHARTPGKLVIRVSAQDSGYARPNGTVRLVPTSTVDGGATKMVKMEAPGLARSGPLEAGRWVVEANGRGYETGRLTVAVRPGATDTVRFRLARACTQQRASR